MSEIAQTILQSYTLEELKTIVKNKLSEEDIMNHYLGELSPRMKNSLRDDKHDGCNLFVGRSGDLLFHDFAQNKTYNCYGIVMQKYGLTYKEAMIRILTDFYGLGHITLPKTKRPVKVLKKALERKSEQYIQIQTRPFVETDKEYWKQFGITRKILNEYNVFAVEKVWRDGKIYMYNTQNNPIYAYVDFKHNKIKLYRPLATTEDKWRGNFTKDIIDGWDQLPREGKLCLITSSRKDVMCLKALGFNAVATQGERTSLSRDKIQDLERRFDRILSFMDNDQTGREAYANYLEKEIQGFILPDELSAKDISDCFSSHGRFKTSIIINTLISNTIFQHGNKSTTSPKKV